MYFFGIFLLWELIKIMLTTCPPLGDKTETKKRFIPDLQPIKECKKKNQKLKVRFAKEKEEDESKKLRKNVELSMRQRQHKINYKSRLEILKGL